MATSRTRARRSSRMSCKTSACGSAGGGLVSIGNSEAMYAMGGESLRTPVATCPMYTGVIIYLLVLFLTFVALNWTFKPTFMLKPGAVRSDPNSVSVTAGMLYALLWTGLVLIAVALVVRCSSCMGK